MSDEQITVDRKIVLNFLCNPIPRKNFDVFFGLCVRETIGYLRYLKARGFILPTQGFEGINPANDLAIDLLGEFFRSESNKPFYIIFDFYKRHGIDKFDETDIVLIYSLFEMLLKGFIRKELLAISGQEDPQVANLKRRFKDILRDSRFICQKDGPLNAEIIYLQIDASNLRRDANPLYLEEILAIAEKAYLDSKSRQEWCELIFKTISEDQDHQNYVRRSDLLRAVIAINIKYSEVEALNLSRFSAPSMAYLHDAVKTARIVTLDWIKESVIDRFIEKKRITHNEAESFLKAANVYLSDFSSDGSTDLVPIYFREIMPEVTQEDYLSKYKYIFETILNQTVEHFREILRNDSTIWQLGHYIKFEKE